MMMILLLPSAWKRVRRCLQTHCKRVGMADPSDGSELRAFAEKVRVVGLLGKTEGNGCVNDFSRSLASLVVKSIVPNACAVMSGGTEGVLTPHYTVFGISDDDDDDRGGPGGALAVGISKSRILLPEEIGTEAQVEATRLALAEASRGMDLKWAQVKCPLLTSQRILQAKARGREVATEDAYESMALSRMASARGVAAYTGETEWSRVASTSAGVELMHCEVMALGLGEAFTGPNGIVNGVMRDALDVQAVYEALERAGLDCDRGQVAEPHRVKAVLAKSDPAAVVRGHRTTMYTDSDINATRHSRAAVAGLLAGVFGDTRLFVSGGAELQGPPGGGNFAVIYE